jgi:hypothetical protein
MRVFVGTATEYKQVAHLFRDESATEAPVNSDGTEKDGKGGTLTAEIIVLALTRIPLSKNQKTVLRTIVEASPAWVNTVELSERTGLTRQELSGVWGALGRRVANTPGWPDDGEAIQTDWDDNAHLWRYRAVPLFVELVKSGRVNL